MTIKKKKEFANSQPIQFKDIFDEGNEVRLVPSLNQTKIDATEKKIERQKLSHVAGMRTGFFPVFSLVPI